MARMQCEQEIRLAVVLYGGVSLAIYINGVTQELWNLVLATADGAKTGSTIEVYREIAQRLGLSGVETGACAADSPIKTRFVIDVLSGTSAGGVNAVFLGKALATGGDFAKIKETWLEVGDIEKLLSKEDKPQAVLSGHYFYQEIYEALKKLDTEAEQSPYARELSVFLTATHLEGKPLKVFLPGDRDGSLTDRVPDRDHRHVFKLEYIESREPDKPSRNDFAAPNNPVLAFAPRVSAGIPGAFDVLTWETYRAGLGLDVYGLPPIADEKGIGSQERKEAEQKAKSLLERFFRGIYGQPNWEQANFVDGGVVDNHPFAPAVEESRRKVSDLPYQRKLLYVDPFPGDGSSDQAIGNSAPDPVLAPLGALNLLRDEPIRYEVEELNRINKVVETISRTTAHLYRDILATLSNEGKPLHRDDPSFRSYLRLRTSTTTDLIAETLAFLTDKTDPADMRNIRERLRPWRNDLYALKGPQGGFKHEEFHRDFDFAFLLRKLNFLGKKADELLRTISSRNPSARQESRDQIDELVGVAGLGPGDGWNPPALPAPTGSTNLQDSTYDQAWRDFAQSQQGVDFARGLAGLKKQINNLQRGYVGWGQSTRRKDQDNPLLEQSNGLIQRLNAELEPGFEGERVHLKEFLAKAKEKVAAEIGSRSALLDDLLKPLISQTAGGSAAYRCIGFYSEWFELYDSAIFPVEFNSRAEDGEHVDVIRVSPSDALLLDDHRLSDEQIEALAKCMAEPDNDLAQQQLRIRTICEKPIMDRRLSRLAGGQLAAFGAFFRRSWRVNDIMWGRLSAAEILIRALLPIEHGLGKDEKADLMELRRGLIEKSAKIILSEELNSLRQELKNDSRKVDPVTRDLICQDVKELEKIANDPNPDAVEFMRTFDLNTQMDQTQLKTVGARATNVVLNVLKGGKASWYKTGADYVSGALKAVRPNSLPNTGVRAAAWSFGLAGLVAAVWASQAVAWPWVVTALVVGGLLCLGFLVFKPRNLWWFLTLVGAGVAIITGVGIGFWSVQDGNLRGVVEFVVALIAGIGVTVALGIGYVLKSLEDLARPLTEKDSSKEQKPKL